MINLLTEAVSIAIHAEFGDGYPIYKEEIRQGFEEPCFFISCLNPTKKEPAPAGKTIRMRNAMRLRNGCAGVWNAWMPEALRSEGGGCTTRCRTGSCISL